MPVYLELFHGRTTPDEDLDGWGFQGPVLGPLPFFHVTYGFDCKFEGDFDLDIRDGLVFFEGCYYGDFSVFAEEVITDDDTRAEPTLRKRIEETQRVLKSTEKDWPVMITDEENIWVRNFAERRLQGKPIGENK